MNPLDLPVLAKLAIVTAIVAAAAAGVGAFIHHEREIGRDEVRAEWSKEKAKQTAAALAESQKNAQETARRLMAKKEAQDAHDKEIAQARLDADAARAAAGRLSGQLAAFTAAARRAAGNPAAVGDGQAAGTALDLLAELFSRSDATAGELAAALDASHAAGLQCEREHDSLTVKD